MGLDKADTKSHKNQTLSSDTTETAFVLHPVLPLKNTNTNNQRNDDVQLEEAIGLTMAIDLKVIHSEIIQVHKPNAGRLFASGAIERIRQAMEDEQPAVIIINHALSPIQQRNLEREWKTKVIDRTGLILEIFGRRAQTKEGKLQVDLAYLTYQRSRLVRSWTHLERQRGGAGFMGGPGETQIEIDRRIISDKITKLKKQLNDVRRTRNLQKESREKVPFPVVALVGYTNAGKSTLFNHITGAKVFAKDLLFATLDPTMRGIDMPSGQRVILSDTVGFISDLPTQLIAAFRATLEQVQHASVILHVRDISQPYSDAEKQDVIDVLEGLGIDYHQDNRIIEVLNKIDLANNRESVVNQAELDERVVALSAMTGEGVPALFEAVQNILEHDNIAIQVDLLPSQGKALSWLYDHGDIKERRDQDKKISITISMKQENLNRFHAEFPDIAARATH